MRDVIGIIFRTRRIKFFLIGIILGLLRSQIIHQFVNIHRTALVSGGDNVAVDVPEVIVVRKVTGTPVRVVNAPVIHGINEEFHPLVVDIRHLGSSCIHIFATHSGGVEGRLHIPAYLAGILNIIGMERNNMGAVVAVTVEYFLKSDNHLAGGSGLILMERVRAVVGLNFGLNVISPVDEDVVDVVVIAKYIEIGHV